MPFLLKLQVRDIPWFWRINHQPHLLTQIYNFSSRRENKIRRLTVSSQLTKIWPGTFGLRAIDEILYISSTVY